MRVLPILALCLAACGGSSSQSTTTTATPKTEAAPAVPTSFRVTVSGTGRPVIFMPGLTCDEHVWDATIAHLGGKYETHVISLAGFSGNAPIDKPLLPAVRDELITYIQEHHLEKPIFVGHSIGGFMAYWLAETAPDLLGGAVAVDGAPFLPALINPAATVENATPMAAAMRDQMTANSAAFGDNIKKFSAGMMLEPAKHQAIIDASAKSDPKTTADTMFLVMQTDLRPQLTAIKAPIVVIAADGNGEIPRAALEATWHAQIDPIPTHDLVFVDKSKHFVMLDQPDAFYAALDAALAKH